MNYNEELDSEYLAMAELTREIGSVVQSSINHGHQYLSPVEIEHILSMTSNVTLRMEVRFKIEHISMMTQTITTKLKKTLTMNQY